MVNNHRCSSYDGSTIVVQSGHEINIFVSAKVVKDATLVKSRKNYDLFLKRGGIKQARKDFRLFRPTETGDTGVCFLHIWLHIQSTLVISNSKGLSEILRDIRSSTYQVCRIVEKNNLINYI